MANRVLTRRTGAGIMLLVSAAALYWRSRLPRSAGGHRSSAPVGSSRDTALGRIVEARAGRHPGLSGVYPLLDGSKAFAARLALADRSEASLDVQYYIWEQELSGTLLLDALHRAAERGTRVRLLLDDNGTVGLDEILSALNSLPNFEVRLYNPLVLRRARILNFLVHFRRLNRRMHNKSFTADGQATVIGGRNVGDRYFEAVRGSLFMDVDVLAVGPVVKEMARQFEAYWTSASAFPASSLLPPVSASQIGKLRVDAERVTRAPAARRYADTARRRDPVADLLLDKLPLEWARTRLLSDNPAKTLGRADPDTLLVNNLEQTLGDPKHELWLVSGYFVPTRASAAKFAAMARRGVVVRILTNALDATDVKVVTASYGIWRRALLMAGVRLYEIRGGAVPREPRLHRMLRPGASGVSGSVLHAKAFTVDRSRFFVGSFNLDPRSALLNTEQGLVIESPKLARQMSDRLIERLPEIAYELCLDSRGRVNWLECQTGGIVRHRREPGTSWGERIALGLLSRLPVASLL